MLQEITHGELRRCAQAERHRRRNAKALLLDLIAVNDFVQMPHEVETKGRGVVDPLVDVARTSGEKAIAETERPTVDTIQTG